MTSIAPLPTLFLDRDGVINERTPGDYVRTPEMFEPTEGLGEAMRLLAKTFGRIIVVTNQAGIGRGLMTEADLAAVHQKMLDLVEAAGGCIARVYHCPHAKDAGCRCRKPTTGMAWLALADFPEIDFTNAWLAGDSASDMQFAQSLGMRSVLIEGKIEEAEELAKMKIDFRFGSLLEFARFFANP
jgi:D-glycero-D-manno-heptose 1,7-bisphosphate phosphatase